MDNGKVLTVSRKLAKILTVSRRSRHPIETLLKQGGSYDTAPSEKRLLQARVRNICMALAAFLNFNLGIHKQ